MTTTAGLRLRLHPDRLLPTEPGVRAIARRLYDAVRELPIISPHGHVDPRLLLDNAPFPDPAALFVTPDHYVTRLLHASGVALDELGVGRGPLPEEQARQVWRLLCAHWDVYRGTPVRYWLESELSRASSTSRLRPSAATADAIYDQIAERLATDAYRPRALYERFGIEVLATTDDPSDDLSAHAALAADPTWSGRVMPTFRPDRYLEPAQPGWPDAVAQLGKAADVDTGDYAGYVRALETRRRYFVEHGAVSADHSHVDVRTDPLEPAEAARIYRSALAGDADPGGGHGVPPAHAAGDGPDVLRRRAGHDPAPGRAPRPPRPHHVDGSARTPGNDIPVPIEFTDALRPLLERYGTHPGFHLVLFTVDETVFSRELAPLAGFYPARLPGRALVVPRRPARHPPLPGGGHRDRRVLPHLRVHRRHPRVLLDPGPPRHVPPRRRRLARRARRRAPARRGRGARDRAIDLVADQPRKVFKL